LDPLVAPAVVLSGEPLDERGDLGADWGPSRPVRVGPLAGDQAVPGVTSRCARSLPGRSRISAAITARSAQSSRGRGWVRRSTATSCRRPGARRPWMPTTGRAGPASRRAGRRCDRAGGEDTDDHDALRLTLVITAAHKPGRLLAPDTPSARTRQRTVIPGGFNSASPSPPTADHGSLARPMLAASMASGTEVTSAVRRLGRQYKRRAPTVPPRHVAFRHKW
jgi:hypothetical protein